jgi:hypothetical protein
MGDARFVQFVVAASIFAASCGIDVTPPPTPVLLATSLDQASERVSPTAPIALTFSLPLDADTVDEKSILVVEGLADGAFGEDHERSPLDGARLAQLVPGAVASDGANAIFQPERPLAPATLHTLVATVAVRAGGIGLSRAATRAFTTGPASAGAPTWTLSDPPSGASGVVRNLREIDVRFSRRVDGVDGTTLRLVSATGPIEAQAVPGDCPSCFRLLPDAPLAASAYYQLFAGDGILDDDGEPPFQLGAVPGFTVGDILRDAAPRLDGIDLVASSGCLVARFTSDVPTIALLCADQACAGDNARRAVHQLTVPLAAGGTAGVQLTAQDESTAPPARFSAAAPTSSPRTLTITEAQARPLGAHLAQQFVEIWNRGAAPIDLDGLELHDELGANTLPAAQLGPGGFALIVPQGFVADDGLDPIPADGTLIVRVAEGHLGGNGIRESGEALALTEPDGRLVSRLSTYGVTVAAGQSVGRSGPCDVASSFRATPGGATPGAP